MASPGHPYQQGNTATVGSVFDGNLLKRSTSRPRLHVASFQRFRHYRGRTAPQLFDSMRETVVVPEEHDSKPVAIGIDGIKDLRFVSQPSRSQSFLRRMWYANKRRRPVGEPGLP